MLSKGLLLVIAFHQALAKLDDAGDALLGRAIAALDKVLDFILDDYMLMNVDGMFAISIALGSLLKANENAHNTSSAEQLLALAHKTQLLYDMRKPTLPTYFYIDYLFVNYLLPPGVWANDIAFTHGKLQPGSKDYTGRYKVNDGFSYLIYLDSYSFEDIDSDVCIVEILSSSNGTEPHVCPISQRCLDYMLTLPTGYAAHFPGYGATHMLLAMHLTKIKSCQFNFSMDDRIEDICSYILWELRKNVEFGCIPNLEDLFYEQITFCGLDGYAEFLKIEYLEYVLQQQESHGGFRLQMLSRYEAYQRYRSKRASTFMKYGANSHTTGLAASVLALFIRLMVEKPFEGRAFVSES